MRKVLRTFIIDDESDSRDLLSFLLMHDRQLEVIGYYADASNILQEIEQYNPDVIFTDISLPVLGGIEAAELIREKFPHVKIVFLTAYSKYKSRAMQLAPSGFLLKPFDLDDVKACLYHLKQD
ncbi:MAG: LytR/AlgR family response regulator transcription factor [Bacteroidota bacterium]